jgi:hypothetical protein
MSGWDSVNSSSNHGIVDPASGTPMPQAGRLVKEPFLRGGELEDNAAGGAEGGVPLVNCSLGSDSS